MQPIHRPTLSRFFVALVLLFAALLLPALISRGTAAEVDEPAAPTWTIPEPFCFWTGDYNTTYGPMVMEQNGLSVSAEYKYGDDGPSYLQGAVMGNELEGEWTEPPTYAPPFDMGQFRFLMLHTCSGWSGQWKSDGSDWPGSNNWSGARMSGQALLDPYIGLVASTGGTARIEIFNWNNDTFIRHTLREPGEAVELRPGDVLRIWVGEEGGWLKAAVTCEDGASVRRVLSTITAWENTEQTAEQVVAELTSRTWWSPCYEDNQRVAVGANLPLSLTRGEGAIILHEGLTQVGFDTPIATAYLKGAGVYEFAYDPNGATAAYGVLSGSADVVPAGAAEAIELVDGQRVSVGEGGPDPVIDLHQVMLPAVLRSDDPMTLSQ